MDNDELENDHSFYQALFEEDSLEDGVSILTPAAQIDNEVVDILKQRKDQRAQLLDFLVRLASDVLALFIVLAFAQISFKVMMGIDVVPESVFNIITVGVFGELIMTIREVTKALWNEKDILTSPLIDKIRSSKSREPDRESGS